LYQQAIEARPDSAGYFWGQLGDALLAQKRPGEAIAAFSKAIQLNPEAHHTYTHLSHALVAQGKPDEAVDVWRQGIESAPKGRSYLRSNLIAHLQAQGKHDQVFDVYRKAIEADSNDVEAYFGIAAGFRRQKKFPEAIAAYHKLISLSPKHPVAYQNLGDTLEAQGNLEEAIEAYYKAIEFAPTGKHLVDGGRNHAAAVYLSIGNVFSKNHHPSAAIPAHRRGLELDPKRMGVAASTNLGMSLAKQNKYDQAIAAYRKAIELDQKRVEAVPRNQLAWLLATCPDAKFRDPAEAVGLAQEAVKLRPSAWPIANTLGVAQHRAGDWKAAIAALEKSMALIKGGNSNDWFFLATAHWQLGDKDKARAWFDRAVQWMDKNQP
jgi:superkiller protein 3